MANFPDIGGNNRNGITTTDAITSNAKLLSSAATVNATNIKATGGTLMQISGYNAAVSARYLKLYDKATTPVVGTDVPRQTYYLPAGSAFVFDNVGSFPNGIGFAITANAADADATAIAVGDIVCLNVDFK